MKISKKIIAIFAMAVAAVSMTSNAYADDECAMALIVHMQDGNKELYKLAESPEVTFDGETMLINSESLQGSYSTRDVSHYEIKEEKFSGVEAITVPEEAAFSVAYIDNATVSVSAPELTKVDVYNASGAKVATVAAIGGTATISLASQPAGVYILSPNCHSAIKIAKK